MKSSKKLLLQLVDHQFERTLNGLFDNKLFYCCRNELHSVLLQRYFRKWAGKKKKETGKNFSRS